MRAPAEAGGASAGTDAQAPGGGRRPGALRGRSASLPLQFLNFTLFPWSRLREACFLWARDGLLPPPLSPDPSLRSGLANHCVLLGDGSAQDSRGQGRPPWVGPSLAGPLRPPPCRLFPVLVLSSRSPGRGRKHGVSSPSDPNGNLPAAVSPTDGPTRLRGCSPTPSRGRGHSRRGLRPQARRPPPGRPRSVPVGLTHLGEVKEGQECTVTGHVKDWAPTCRLWLHGPPGGYSAWPAPGPRASQELTHVLTGTPPGPCPSPRFPDEKAGPRDVSGRVPAHGVGGVDSPHLRVPALSPGSPASVQTQAPSSPSALPPFPTRSPHPQKTHAGLLEARDK